ncbi:MULTISPECIES: hypothetical protein [unclassified Pseudoclavibacter]|uniref:hypothetical protein n=1 Tax=unclassified Pseudoclavibacter TaxID=2615177 RepID=UPI001300D319|nr:MULTISPECIES: hypothetical protein [unclassified Pseudoclavibacter]KAB1645703.1 hypothetical protein F8O06_09100 [Pseudoclavibacter sp. CFCC 14310]KAB1664389.1 hypothetical protein F8O08_03055 [Pseudoclavibacter sp. CFCC 13611]
MTVAMLRLDHAVLSDVSARLSACSAEPALSALRHIVTAEGVDYGDADVQAALSDAGCALSQAAVVVYEGTGYGSTAAARISSGVIDADMAAGLAADQLSRGGGGM